MLCHPLDNLLPVPYIVGLLNQCLFQSPALLISFAEERLQHLGVYQILVEREEVHMDPVLQLFLRHLRQERLEVQAGSSCLGLASRAYRQPLD